MRWNAATGAIARCKAMSIAYARKGRLAHAWRWTCGVKPTPKAVNKPSPHFIVHGLDKPGGFTTVSKIHSILPASCQQKAGLSSRVSLQHTPASHRRLGAVPG